MKKTLHLALGLILLAGLVLPTPAGANRPGAPISVPADTPGQPLTAASPATITATPYFTDVAPMMNATAPGYGTAVAWGDYDGDGDLDLYVVKLGPGPGGESSILLRNDGSTFTDVTAEAGVGNTLPAVAGVWADYDNDGDLDLFVSNRPGNNALYHNDGSGHFQNVAVPAGVNDPNGMGEGAAWADVDCDGLLDLYVANYSGASPPYNQPNRLFQNLGGSRFRDVASERGVANWGNGEGIAWADFDNDGDLDLYIANTNGSTLYQQQSDGTFHDVTGQMHVPGGPGASYGAAWGDYDNDGWLDLYVAQQGANKLYRNLDGTDFADVTDEAGVGGDRWSLGVAWGDYDDDGRLDLYVANAVVSGYDPADVLYHNEGNNPITFTDVTAPAGVTNTLNTRGCAWGDLDNDGWLDLYVVNQGANQPNRLFHNNGNANHWLEVALTGCTSNRSAIGARVVATSDQTQVREISGGSGFASQDSLPAEFGLGSWSGPVTVTVRWPSGIQSVRTDLAVDRIITVTEPCVDLADTAKSVDAATALPGAVLTYTIVLRNSGDYPAPARLTDTLPLSVTWGNHLTATSGSPLWDAGGQRVLWAGVISAGMAVTMTYQVTIQEGLSVGVLITNSATVDDGYRPPFNTAPVTTTVLCAGPAEVDFVYWPALPLIGQEVRFTATATGSLPISYTWALGDGSVASGAYITHTYAAAGSYAVVLSATNCATTTVTVTHTVIVVASPCVPVEGAGFSWTPFTPTVGETVTFTGTVTAGDEPITYSWAFGNGAGGEGPVIATTYGGPGTYTATLTATNCVTATVTAIHTLTVVPLPCAAVTILTVTTDISRCAVTFGAELTGDPPFTYLWDFRAWGTSTATNPLVDFAQTGTYTGTLSVWNCGNTVPATRAFTVMVACPRDFYVYLPIVLKDSP